MIGLSSLLLIFTSSDASLCFKSIAKSRLEESASVLDAKGTYLILAHEEVRRGNFKKTHCRLAFTVCHFVQEYIDLVF